MNCKKCNCTLKKGAKFCQNCGAPIEKVTKNLKNPPMPLEMTEPRPSEFVTGILVLLLFLLAFGGAFVFLYIFSKLSF